MGLNDTPIGERISIALFGKTNAGKSSVINAITNQNIAIVSDVKGTTTDPVYKTMEILPLGPVVLIDTPGLDDDGVLGKMRIKKANDVLKKTDIAVIVVDILDENYDIEYELINTLNEKKIFYIICFNKIDLVNDYENKINIYKSKFSNLSNKSKICFISAEKKLNINDLINCFIDFSNEYIKEQFLIKDLVNKNELVVLVIPIDKASPKGRLILPQQQVIRELLDNGSYSLVVRDFELENIIKKYKDDIKLVVTDSQVFDKVSKIVKDDILLTSFSVLYSRYKGDFFTQVDGLKVIKELTDGDKILIAEGCTHKRQCGDIGTEKIPKALIKYSKKNLIINFVSGGEFPDDVSDYKLIIHCGGCMLNNREIKSRINIAKESGVAITNYGLFLAYINGILDRSIKPIINNERSN